MSYRIRIISFIFLGICFCVEAQDYSPTSAPKIDPFSLSPDNLGSLANSVNLFTGDVNLPFSLVSIPGRENAGIDVTMVYNSNIQNQVSQWNYEAPTGLLGLGWTLGSSQILVDNRQTAAREDDRFYIVEGGVSTALIATKIDATVRIYKPQTSRSWIVNYYPTLEKWEVIRENGSKFIYGDQNSNRSTLQKIVTWGNWIGASALVTGQETQVAAWNLSEVNNIYGDKVYYSYSESTQQVGTGGLSYTESSYIDKIYDNKGNEVQFSYGIKNPQECPDVHAENGEHAIDAHQERIEKKFLNKISVLSNNFDPSTYFEVRFSYNTDLLGAGYFTKRLLTSISKYAPQAAAQISATYFEYLSAGAMSGALYRVSSSLGSSVTYDYHTGLDITQSNREKNTGSGLLNVWMYGDYLFSLVHSGASNSSTLRIHTWDGKWRSASQETIGNTRLQSGTISSPDVSVALAMDFFAILNQNDGSVHLWHKSDIFPGGWTKYTSAVPMGSHKMAAYSGDGFVAIRNGDGNLSTFIWNGDSWRQEVIHENLGLSAVNNTTSGSNFIVSHHVSPNPDKISINYLDERKIWNAKTMTTAFNASAEKNWYASNSFAIGMIDGTEKIARWDKNYNLSVFDTGFEYDDINTYVFIPNESMITLIGRSNSLTRSLRFNGGGWNDTGNNSYQVSSQCSAGSDVFSWMPVVNSNPRNAKFKDYNANSLSWNADNSLSFSNTYPITVTGGIPDGIGNRFLLINDKFYFRKANGTWSNDANFSYTGLASLSGASFTPGFNFITYTETMSSTGKLLVQFIKNGALGNLASVSNKGATAVYKYSSPGNAYDYLVSGSTIATASGYLFQALNDHFTGPMRDYPVVRMTINDGIQNRFTSYQYDGTKAVFDATGTVTQYNKVTVVPGSANASSKPFGYSEVFFYNGLTEADLGEWFPRETIGNGAHYRELFAGNAVTHTKPLTGLSYRTNVYNSSNAAPVSQTETIWQVDAVDIYIPVSGPSLKVDRIYFPHPLKTITTTDGIQNHTEYQYKTTTFQLASQKSYNRTELGYINETGIEYKYGWEVNDVWKSANVLQPIVQVKKSIGYPSQKYIESTVTRLKLFNSALSTTGFPFPYDTYMWKRTGSVDFTTWDASLTPSGDWEYSGKVSERDYDTSLPIEQLDNTGRPLSQLYDQYKERVIANANAPFVQIAYNSFEDNAKGNFAWNDGTIVTGAAKTGSKYMTLGAIGITKTGLTGGANTISFWAKSNGGSVTIDGKGTVDLGVATEWKLYTYTVSGYTSINIRRAGSIEIQIDEIRLHPTDAHMTTYTYHPLYGITSETDQNHKTVYTEYDDLGRVSLIKDNDKNIIKAYTYNIKK